MSREKTLPDTPPDEVTSPRRRHPLGLPAGSVRALLTLIVVGFIITQTIRGIEVRLLWTETLMIVLAHYFTTRRMVALPEDLKKKLEDDGELEPDEQPLYLPRHSIRLLIVAGFVGLAVYLANEGRLFEKQAIGILGTVGAYLLGVGFRGVWNWITEFTESETPNWWIDLKAVVTIAVVVVTVLVQLLGLGPKLPFPVSYLENASLGLTLFYFGSR